MSVILCLLIYTPAYAVIPAGSIEHTVTILSGEGRILKNKDETYIENHIKIDNLDELEEIDQMQYQVVDGENLKDMLDYSNCDGTIYTAAMNSNLIAKLKNIPSGERPLWREVAFIASTRVVNHFLSLIEASGIELTSGYTDYFDYLPTGIHQLLFFVPPSEEYSFSHFVDQDGNEFKPSDSVTRDLVLTPVYTTDEVVDTIDKTEETFHQVTYLPGEGRIEYVKTHREWGYDDNGNRTWEDFCDGYREIDQFIDLVKDGKRANDRYDVIQSYAIYQWHDFPVAFNLLLKKEADCVEYLNDKDLYGAITELDESITIANKYMFSSPYYYQENVRPYSISLLAFLSNFTYNSKRLSDILIDQLGDLEDAYLNWDSYTDEEKDEFITGCIDTITQFENTARNFVNLYYSYMTPSDQKSYRFSGTDLEDWVRDDVYTIYYETDELNRASLYDGFSPTNKVVFVPPEGYEFDHFEDQNGNVYDPKTLVTEDLVLTPIFRELHEYHLTYTKGEGELRLLYKYSPYYDGAYHSTVLSNQSLDELSIRSWRGNYTYTRETDGELETMSSSDYMYLVNLRGTSEYESYTARDNYERLSSYSDGSNLWFIPPMNKIFDHFEDENGDVWEPGTELTKDTIVTPIYRDIMADALITVETEDNSDEAMQVYVNRDLHKYLSENGFDITDYEGTVFDYLNDKSSYVFNESDWEITEDGVITKYTGNLVQMLGIPDSINGITVTEISTHAFDDLFERTKENQENPNYYDEYDYLRNITSVWVPKSVTNLTDGLNLDKMVEIASEGEVNKADAEFIKQLFIQVQLDEAAEEGMSDEELAQLREQLNESISISIDTYGTNDCTPFAFLPYSYIVVDPQNKTYKSIGGNLYDKNLKRMYYATILNKAELSYAQDYSWGTELPKSLEYVSAFTTYNAYDDENYMSLTHVYGTPQMNYYYAAMTMHDLSTDEAETEPIVSSMYLSQYFVTTEGENIKDYLSDLFRTLFADGSMSEEEIIAELEETYRYMIYEVDEPYTIDQIGTISQSSPFNAKLNTVDVYHAYSATLLNVPDRYVVPSPIEIDFHNPEKQSGHFYLRLKRGNIEVETVDANDSSKHLEASYTIYNSNGNEVATITATGEMDTVGYGNLTYGTYTVVQTTVENGYLRNTDIKTASITEDGELIQLTFSNHTTSGMYSVRIPKTIVLDGNTGTGSCVISVMGTIDSTRQITVTPEQATFSLEEQNATVDKKSLIEATIESNKTKWLSSDLSETDWSSTVWNISAPLTAGCWYGRTNIIIQIKEKE